MEWEVWLEKGKKVQLSIAGWNEEEKPKKKVKFREDDDKGGAWEDSGYAKNASWESWLEKKDINDNYKKVMDRATELSPNSCEDNEHCGATSGAINEQLKDGKQKLSHIRGITNDKDHAYNKNRKGHIIDASREQFGDKKGIHVIKPDDERYKEYEDVMPHKKNPFLDRISLVDEKKSWELFLEKNNAIETSHKENEKKIEWDGKFSSSTIRDDAKDDKAMDEESDEIMEDAGLEEVEKLKSWEVFLDKMGEGGTSHATSIIPNEEEKEKRIFNKNPPKNVKSHFENIRDEKPAVTGTKIIPTDRKGTFQDTKGTKHMTGGDHKAVATRVAETNPDYAKFMTDVSPKEQLGSDTDKPVKTQKELDKEFYERTQPEPKGTTKTPAQMEASRSRTKAWEVWLTKYVETDSDKELSIEIDTARQRGLKKIPKQRTKPESGVDAKEDEISRINAEKWKSWLEKMQGAGDARFGNQHLTGLDQKPVNDEVSEANILPEKDEKQDRKDEKEDKTEEKDNNKPYKALSVV